MAKYAGIIPNDTVDVDGGIAVSFWVQGCPHRCVGCHNPETIDENGGYELPSNYVEQIKKLLVKHGVKRKLSILGGEPLCEYNRDIVLKLVKEVKADLPDTKILIWSGGVFEALLGSYLDILKYVDILIDGPFVLEKRDITLPLRGSTNQRVIDVQQSLAKDKVVVISDNRL